MPHTYSVGVGFYLSVGSRYEEAPIAGAAHFVEHMVFKGTARRPSADLIAREIEGRGGMFNASTGQEMTIYWAKMQKPHLDVALDVIADMLRNSTLSDVEIEKERRVILEELLASQDVPEELVGLLVQNLTWPAHPLGWDVAGTLASVADLSVATLRGFLQRFYAPPNIVLSIAGDVDHQRATELAHRLMGDWAPAPRVAYCPAPPDGAAAEAVVLHKKTEQSHFTLHLPGLARNDPDRFALNLLNVILGEGMSSRLFLELRERLGIVYSVESYISLLADTGLVGVYAAVAPARLRDALQAVVEQLVRLRDETLSDVTLAEAKEYVKGRILMGLEDTLSVAGWFGRQQALGPEVLTVEQVLAGYEAVSVQDVQRVAGRVFRPAGLRLAVVGPHRKTEASKLTSMVSRGLAV
jgi:predicted Zn-dependent peptidase